MAGCEADNSSLEEFAADVSRHLRLAWRQGTPVRIALEGLPPLVIDTVADLEAIHHVIADGHENLGIPDTDGTRDAKKPPG